MKRVEILFILLSILFLACSEPVKVSYVSFVNPLMGTDSEPSFSHGNVYPAVGVPFGMTHWTPQTGEWNWIYQYGKNTFQGLRATHQPSPWIGDYGQFTIMPIHGNPIFDDVGRQVTFSHENEISKPNYYRVKTDDGIVSELTATSRAGMIRFTFPEESNSVVFDASKGFSSLKFDPDKKEITGFNTINSGGVPENFAAYFIVKIVGDINNHEMLTEGEKIAPTNEVKGNDSGIFLNFSKGKSVELKIGTSFISIEQARKNLESELGDSSFGKVVKDSEIAWNKELSKIEIESDNSTLR